MSTATPRPDDRGPVGTAASSEHHDGRGPADQIQRSDSGGGRTSVLWPVLTVLFAAVAAVLAFLLLRPEGGEEAAGLTTSATEAAGLACQIMDEIDPSATDAATDEGWVVMTQLGAVSSLGWVATAHDESYADLRDTLEEPRLAQARTFTMESEEFATAMDDARAACERILADD